MSGGERGGAAGIMIEDGDGNNAGLAIFGGSAITGKLGAGIFLQALAINFSQVKAFDQPVFESAAAQNANKKSPGRIAAMFAELEGGSGGINCTVERYCLGSRKAIAVATPSPASVTLAMLRRSSQSRRKRANTWAGRTGGDKTGAGNT